MTTPTKYRNGVVPLVCFLFFFITANLTFAETKVFVEEYTYQASEADSKLSSRVIALEQVKRLLLEKLGTYLESETEVKNFQLTKDQIVILTAGIVTAEIVDEKWDGKTYYLKAKIAADPKEVIKSIDLLRQDRQKTKELEETRKKADEALREVERLKKELEVARVGKTEQDQYNKAVNRLSATDWRSKGIALGNDDNHREAVEAFTKAIELDPKDKDAYFHRGFSYNKLGDYQQAIKDFDKAIEITPKHVGAYYFRGMAYLSLENYQQSIKDLDRAIQLNPKFWFAYFLRGDAYGKLGDYPQAIKNYDRAIQLNPKDADFYRSRGMAYGFLENYQQAIKDFDKLIELNPKNAIFYFWRGDAYGKLGDNRREISNFRNAARLGHKEAQDLLKSKGISW
jgi:tetratricopeptide (TPR) repeat protein